MQWFILILFAFCLYFVPSVLELGAVVFAADREDHKGDPLDLSSYHLQLLYRADFSKPLRVVRERELFKGDKRVHKPAGYEWVLEGAGSACTEDGRLYISNSSSNGNTKSGHTVLWNTQVFPANFLLEFEFSPKNSNKGLAIVFFAAGGKDGGGIFDLDQPFRGGNFGKYTEGAIDTYHVSFWAIHPETLEPRGQTNLRKNYGFQLVASGEDNIAGKGSGPHKVRLLKVGDKIKLETRGKVIISWQDKEGALSAGKIGLRTMEHTEEATYTNFRVWRVVQSDDGSR